MPDRAALLSDEQLERLYDDTVVALYRYAARRCAGDRELAEDVTQETWLRAVQAWGRMGAPENPLAWLTAVARNLIVSQSRGRERVSLESVSAVEVLAAVEQNTVASSAEIASLVSGALAQLPREQARLLEAFHYDRLKMSQIAESYGISERAVEGRLHRARERLRRTLVLTLKAEGEI